MTDKLFALINKLRPTEGISQSEINQIQKAAWKIEKYLEKYKLKNSEILHNFAKMVFSETSLEIQEIKKYISEQESKLENGMDNVKLEKVNLTIQALSEIGTILDDLRTVILEHLIIYFPKEYKQYLPELEKLNRFSKVVKIEKLRKPQTEMEHPEANIQHPKKVKKEEPNLPTSFKEVFTKIDLMEPCLNILRNAEPPLISDENNFIGSLKGALVLWLELLQKNDIIKKFNNDRKVYPTIFENEFTGLTIHDSTFATTSTRARENYDKYFQNEILQIKASQK